MSNIYSEEFRTNVVAVVRSGFGIEKLAKRLSIPPTSVRNWVKNPKYANVLPAGEDLLRKLPEEQAASQGLVLIGENTAFVNRCCLLPSGAGETGTQSSVKENVSLLQQE